MTDAILVPAGAGRHAATADDHPGLSLVLEGGRHAAYGSASDLVVNAGDAAAVLADAAGVRAARLLADPSVLAATADAARAGMRRELRRLGARGFVTRAGRAERARLETGQELVERAVLVLGEAHRSLRAHAS